MILWEHKKSEAVKNNGFTHDLLSLFMSLGKDMRWIMKQYVTQHCGSNKVEQAGWEDRQPCYQRGCI